ncbi:hypothetical protein PRIC1_000474 [Phytophthora ramorum]|uniref:uncharacterized protein n=1 Tax=Phytophthora ramorum TaxID=164328 RepID=UPI00309CB568|nr:hypothetical protein KRP23_7149 [Phytophthora ramorum]KAH7498134.1 hypothetical protein KRP22_12251 [Phytophthora ramorum]
MSENPVSCVVLTVHNSKLFNSVDEIANLFLELGVLTGIMALQYGKKELFVPVPSDLAIGIISGKMEELASSVDVGVQMKVEDFTNLAANVTAVFDMLLRKLQTAIGQELELREE